MVCHGYNGFIVPFPFLRRVQTNWKKLSFKCCRLENPKMCRTGVVLLLFQGQWYEENTGNGQTVLRKPCWTLSEVSFPKGIEDRRINLEAWKAYFGTIPNLFMVESDGHESDCISPYLKMCYWKKDELSVTESGFRGASIKIMSHSHAAKKNSFLASLLVLASWQCLVGLYQILCYTGIIVGGLYCLFGWTILLFLVDYIVMCWWILSSILLDYTVMFWWILPLTCYQQLHHIFRIPIHEHVNKKPWVLHQQNWTCLPKMMAWKMYFLSKLPSFWVFIVYKSDRQGLYLHFTQKSWNHIFLVG